MTAGAARRDQLHRRVVLYLRNRLSALKGGTVGESLEGWNLRELFSLTRTLSRRMIRGQVVRLRLGSSRGPILCGRDVRIHHGRHISCGTRLNLEDGCEIVGLSKRGIKFGDRCTVGRLATIRPTNVLLDEPGEGLQMGDNSNIGAYSFVGCSGFVQIGSNVMMGPNVSLLAESHVFESVDVSIKSQGIERLEIHIQDDCWIGAGAIILPGVTVRTGSIVASGAVVTTDVPPYSIVAGVPARVIRSRRGS